MTLWTTTALARPALYAGLFLALAATHAYAQDDRCQQLVALHNQYKGVVLTAYQQQLKTQMVVWYKANCTRSHFRRRLHSASYAE
jgi:hypothetical protein